MDILNLENELLNLKQSITKKSKEKIYNTLINCNNAYISKQIETNIKLKKFCESLNKQTNVKNKQYISLVVDEIYTLIFVTGIELLTQSFTLMLGDSDAGDDMFEIMLADGGTSWQKNEPVVINALDDTFVRICNLLCYYKHIVIDDKHTLKKLLLVNNIYSKYFNNRDNIFFVSEYFDNPHEQYKLCYGVSDITDIYKLHISAYLFEYYINPEYVENKIMNKYADRISQIHKIRDKQYSIQKQTIKNYNAMETEYTTIIKKYNELQEQNENINCAMNDISNINIELREINDIFKHQYTQLDEENEKLRQSTNNLTFCYAQQKSDIIAKYENIILTLKSELSSEKQTLNEEISKIKKIHSIIKIYFNKYIETYNIVANKTHILIKIDLNLNMIAENVKLHIIDMLDCVDDIYSMFAILSNRKNYEHFIDDSIKINTRIIDESIVIKICKHSFFDKIISDIEKKLYGDNMEKIDDASKCKVCYDNIKNIILMPCRHYILCNNCSDNIFVCPICNSKIDERFIVYE